MQVREQMGSLLIIGGSEDRTDDKTVLQRFIKLAGGNDAKIAVLTAASQVPDDVWAKYETAFADLGVKNVNHILTRAREDAEQQSIAELVGAAQGILMTGGDQKRLMAVLGGTATEAAMRAAFEQRGACLAGTSAGASALCAQMVAQGKAELAPEKDAVHLGEGMGFVQGVIVDQHFSQRHRINRLLSVIAQRPSLFGAGIDEDTALIVQPGVGMEVIGAGCVSILDCRHATSNIADIASGETPELFGVQLHLVPSGTALSDDDAVHGSVLSPQAKPAPRELKDFMAQLISGKQNK